MSYKWISWKFLPWELEGITSPCFLLIGQYLHHMTLCPPVAIVKRCYGIHLYNLWPENIQWLQLYFMCRHVNYRSWYFIALTRKRDYFLFCHPHKVPHIQFPNIKPHSYKKNEELFNMREIHTLHTDLLPPRTILAKVLQEQTSEMRGGPREAKWNRFIHVCLRVKPLTFCLQWTQRCQHREQLQIGLQK